MNWKEILLISIKTTSHNSRKEVIEIGICNFDCLTRKKYDPVSLFVKPITTRVTDHCTKITGIAAEDVSDAATFLDVCNFLIENYDSKNRPWASYGNFAETVIRRQCEDNNLEFPLSERFINLRYLFSLFNNLDEEVALNEALAKVSVNVGSNSSEDDVLNIGILLAKILE